ncbi:MAG: chorismate lyase [Magnetococcales bacterium]|nr:chorismate lyase [Magnetococcales bacterium]
MRQPFLPQLLKGWLPVDAYFKRFGLPHSPRLQAALSCTDSLTRHLETESHQTVRVRLEHQAPMLDDADESSLWDQQQRLPPQSMILARSVWLLLEDQARLYAHSQVAIDQLSPAAKTAIEQGDEPLGSLFLAHEGKVERTDLELAEAHIPDLAARLGHESNQSYWCRRSLFRVNHEIRARIYEIFLPLLLS